jgi:hypothetical protein
MLPSYLMLSCSKGTSRHNGKSPLKPRKPPNGLIYYIYNRVELRHKRIHTLIARYSQHVNNIGSSVLFVCAYAVN